MHAITLYIPTHTHMQLYVPKANHTWAAFTLNHYTDSAFHPTFPTYTILLPSRFILGITVTVPTRTRPV
jgi:hypothetical protein